MGFLKDILVHLISYHSLTRSQKLLLVNVGLMLYSLISEKAFDKVPHRRPIQKLKAHGIEGLVVNWVESWLKDRKQRVC